MQQNVNFNWIYGGTFDGLATKTALEHHIRISHFYYLSVSNDLIYARVLDFEIRHYWLIFASPLRALILIKDKGNLLKFQMKRRKPLHFGPCAFARKSLGDIRTGYDSGVLDHYGALFQPSQK